MLFRSLALLFGSISMLQSTAVWGDTLSVPSGAYPTVQSAIDAAQDGDVIAIAPGTYPENLVVAGKALTLQSNFATSNDWADVEATVLQGIEVLNDNGTPADPSDDFLVLGSVLELKPLSSATSQPWTQVNLIGLTFADGESGVLVRPNVRVALSDSRVVGNDDGLELEGRGTAGHGLARAVVKRSLFSFNRDDGVDVDQRAELWIEDSWIQDNDDDGIEIRLQDSAFNPGELVTHVILRNHMLRNGEDGLQLIDDQLLTPRTFWIERNVFADNAQAGLGMMCDQVTIENYEGCPIDEPIRLVHNTFARNDHGLTGGADLIGVGNVFVANSTLGVKNVNGTSLLARSLFFDNGDAHTGADAALDLITTSFEDPLLDENLAPAPTSPLIDAGVASFSVGLELVLDLAPHEYAGTAPDLGAIEARDFSIAKVSAPKKVKFSEKRPSVTSRIKVMLVYRGSQSALMPDAAALASLVRVRVAVPAEATTNCEPSVALTKPSEFPITLEPGKKLKLQFEAEWTCFEALAATTPGEGTEQHELLVWLDPSGLGGIDTEPENDVCPRPSVGGDKSCGPFPIAVIAKPPRSAP